MTVEYLPVIGGEEVQGGFPLCSVLSPGLSFVSPVRYDTSFVESQVTHQYIWMAWRLYRTLQEKQLAHSWLSHCLPLRIFSYFEDKEKLPVTFPLHMVSALDSSWSLFPSALPHCSSSLVLESLNRAHPHPQRCITDECNVGKLCLSNCDELVNRQCLRGPQMASVFHARVSTVPREMCILVCVCANTTVQF